MHINDILDLPNLQDVIQRFERKFVRRGPDDCWEWTGAKMARGYGKVGINHQFWGAHRLAWLFANGPIPNAGRFVGATVCRHKCDNTGCVNPKHIELGTQIENTNDAVSRRRMPLGIARKNCVLTDDEVRAIRADTRLHREIAEDYAVQRRQISRIKQGTRRVHV
jgi:hypothetical protein